MTDINKIIDGCACCIAQDGYFTSCGKCPYRKEEDCARNLAEDTLTALKRLKFLETPTKEEQPELPGINSEEMTVVKKWYSKHGGNPCVIIEHKVNEPAQFNHWFCGYVGVNSSHPCYGLNCLDMFERFKNMNVFGVLTYADDSLYKQKEDFTWWFGFDTFHVGMENVDLNYVVKQCENLSARLTEIALERKTLA